MAIAAVASTVTLLVTGGDDGAGDSVRTVQVSVVGGDSPDAPLKAAYTAAVDGVVQIRTSSGAGTGFVYDDEGTIVTNAHVVGNATSVRVRFGDSTSMIDGRVLGRDASTDLAVVRVDPSEVDKLAPLPLADSDEAETGDQVLAIGYPLGLDQTATGGIVSGVGRSIQAPNGFNIDKVIQTDAPINPGNSGGPLLDVKGRVIGVNSQIATTGRSGGNVGIGYAVPSNTAKDIVPRLAQGQTVERGYMGVSIGPLGSSSAGSGSGGQGGGTSGEGAEVVTVTPNGPAADAGLRGARGSRGGDVIRRIEGEVVKGPDDVTRIVSGRRPGDTVRFEIERDGRRQEVRVRLAKRPDNLPGTTTTVP
ncbi:MAG: S1C family serine protease [Solirubrobacteraceae bacterium]